MGKLKSQVGLSFGVYFKTIGKYYYFFVVFFVNIIY